MNARERVTTKIARALHALGVGVEGTGGDGIVALLIGVRSLCEAKHGTEYEGGWDK